MLTNFGSRIIVSVSFLCCPSTRSAHYLPIRWAYSTFLFFSAGHYSVVLPISYDPTSNEANPEKKSGGTVYSSLSCPFFILQFICTCRACIVISQRGCEQRGLISSCELLIPHHFSNCHYRLPGVDLIEERE